MTTLISYNEDTKVEWTLEVEAITKAGKGPGALPWMLVANRGEGGNVTVYVAAVQRNGDITRNNTMHFYGVDSMDAAQARAVKAGYELA